MIITIKNLRKIIKEALETVRVKTVAPEDYDPPIHFRDPQGPKTSENPTKRAGNFFMTKEKGKLPKGYGSLKKYRRFYMVLPDGEAIRIGKEPLITNDNIGNQYIQLLNSQVKPLPIEDIRNPTSQDLENIKIMQGKIESITKNFARQNGLKIR